MKKQRAQCDILIVKMMNTNEHTQTKACDATHQGVISHGPKRDVFYDQDKDESV